MYSGEIAAKSKVRVKGIAFVLFAATLWGVSGTFAQYLFQKVGVNTDWLVQIRLLFSGLGLLVIACIKCDKNVFKIWKNKHYAFSLIIFSILGMLGVQYSYFTSIKYSNSATATVLQNLGIVIIVLYLAMMNKKVPDLKESLAVILALIGTFLLATNGNFHSLSISKSALFWGVSAAITVAFYTVYPRKLLLKYGSTVVVGWAMLIGGIAFSFFHSPLNFQRNFSINGILAVIFVILLGTLIPFYCYFESIIYIKPSEAGVLSCAEPLSATILAVLWLDTKFTCVELMGILCIVSTIIILSIEKKRR